MARKDLIKNPFPPEHEEEVLDLLETIGGFINTKALADYLGVSHKSVDSFLRTTRARNAASKALPGIRELLRKHVVQWSKETQDPALPDDKRIGPEDNLDRSIETFTVDQISILSNFKLLD